MEQGDDSSQAGHASSSTHQAVPLKAAMDAILATVREAMKGAPPWSKVLIALPTIGGILALLAGSFSSEPYRFWPVVIGLILFLAALVILLMIVAIQAKAPQRAGESPARAAAALGPSAFPAPTAPWRRVVPRLPIPPERLVGLRQELENIRHAAFAWLSQRGHNILLADIRANVFLPDTQAATNGYVCELLMLDQLQVGMEGHPDQHIRFLPQQGLTGAVFVKQDDLFIQAPSVARKGMEGGQEVYALTEDQRQQIDPELCWIVSFPLRIPDQAGGVLNVDGLRHELDEDELRLLMAQLALRVAGFADQLGALPKTRVTIMLEDVGND